MGMLSFASARLDALSLLHGFVSVANHVHPWWTITYGTLRQFPCWPITWYASHDMQGEGNSITNTLDI